VINAKGGPPKGVIISCVVVLLDLVLHPTPHVLYKASIRRIAWLFDIRYPAYFRVLLYLLWTAARRVILHTYKTLVKFGVRRRLHVIPGHGVVII
jgi:hypothetical protein